MPNSSLWNEINTETTLDIFKNRMSAENAIESLYQRRFYGTSTVKLIQLLKLSDLVIKKIWYISGYSYNALYFRRLRIPPMMWIFWDTIIINPILRRLIRKFTVDKKAMIEEASELLNSITTMKSLALDLGIPAKSLDFQYETFKVILSIREYYLGEFTPDLYEKLQNIFAHYHKHYSEGFCVAMTGVNRKTQKKIIDFFFNLIVRKRPEYRLLEKKVFTIILLTIKPLVIYLTKKKMPSIASERAMGVETLLK